MEEIFYYDELEFNKLYVDVNFYIKMDDKNNEIYVDKIIYEYGYKNNRDKKEYKINLKLKLGVLYYILKIYYDTINKYKIPINNQISCNLVLFGYDYIEYFLKICENQESVFFKENDKRIGIFKHQLNKICDILNYHIYKGMNDLDIHKNDDYNDNEYNKLITNLKKYQDLK